MMNERIAMSISEVLVILKNLDNRYIKKVSQGFIEFLENNKSQKYIPNIDLSKELKDMNLQKETRNILELMYFNYWSSPEEKKEFIIILNENERKHQKEINQKYNIDKLFKTEKETITKNVESSIEEKAPIVKGQNSLFRKILNKILDFFSWTNTKK